MVIITAIQIMRDFLIFAFNVRFNLPEEWARGQGAAWLILQENYKIIEACS